MHPSGPLPDAISTLMRVRYNECDPQGIAHHSACATWFEIGRTEILRSAGVTYADLEAVGIYLVVTHLDIRYKNPAKYDDVVLIDTRITGGGRARIDHTYELWRTTHTAISPDARTQTTPQTLEQRNPKQVTTDLLATATSTVACVTRDGRPQPLPGWLCPTGNTRRSR